MRKSAPAFALGVLLASSSAYAATFDLSTPTGVLGPTHTYTSDGLSVIAVAEGGGLLVAKNDGPDEAGLGLTNSSFGDNEVTPGNWISFDVSQLGGDVIFAASSTAGGDIFHLYGSSAAGTLGTSLFAGTGDAPVDLGAIGFAFLNVSADSGPTGNGTILAASLEGLPAGVSEPGTLGILGVGLLVLSWWHRRRSAV